MQRRNFLKNAGVGLAAGAAAIPNLSSAQTAVLPTIKWRCQSSFPKNLDTIFGAGEMISKRVAAATGGKFTIQLFAGGEIVAGTKVMDAVRDGTVECGHTAPYYYFGTDSTFAFGTAMPFGLNARQQNAWMYHGGGLELMREFYAGHNIINFVAGNTGAQMGGWFRKEIKTVADLKGLKMRIAGLAGKVMAKVGVVPQQLPGSDIYPSLEKGVIDAAEWVGPYDDEKLGFHKVAKFYYYPGWWEGGPELDLFVNIKQWDALPPEYKAILEAACAEANGWMLAKYDALNPPALKRLVAQKVQLKAFSKEIMTASYKAAVEVYEEEAAKNPKFAKVFKAWKAFRDDQILWARVAEQNFDSFMAGVEKIDAGKKK